MAAVVEHSKDNEKALNKNKAGLGFGERRLSALRQARVGQGVVDIESLFFFFFLLDKFCGESAEKNGCSGMTPSSKERPYVVNVQRASRNLGRA